MAFEPLEIIGAREMARKAGATLSNAIEDVLAGLLINGVSPGSINVQEHPGCRTIITVDGVPKYEFKLEFVGGQITEQE